MSEFINKNAYVGDTGKQLKDIKTNADNINNKQDTLTTKSVNITNLTNAQMKVYRYGNVVSIDIDGYVQQSGDVIARGLPIPVYLAYMRGLNINEYLFVNYNGELRISADHTSGLWVNFHGVYISTN